jgi:hypothetical protein
MQMRSSWIGFCMVKASLGKLVSLDYRRPTVGSLMRRPAKTSEIDALRFTDKDLDVAGTLDYGQFGVVCVLSSRSIHYAL